MSVKYRVFALIGKTVTTLEEQANVAAEAAIISGENNARQRVEGIKRRAYYQAHLDHNPAYFSEIGTDNVIPTLPDPAGYNKAEKEVYQFWYNLTVEKELS